MGPIGCPELPSLAAQHCNSSSGMLIDGRSELGASLVRGTVRTFVICKPLLLLSVDEVVEDVMGWTCGTCREEETRIHVLVGER
jgi:hypothetical protein